MLGDDTGDNISELNPYLNEMTCLYWLWKHYDEIGNPEYIGLNHYRRITPVKQFINRLSPEKLFVTPEQYGVNMSRHIQYDVGLSFKETFLEVIDYDHLRSDQKDAIDYWFRHKTLYGRNIFVMHRDKFQIYMNYLKQALDKMPPIIEKSGKDKLYHTRTASFMMEAVSCISFIRMRINDGCDINYLFYEYTN